MANAYETLGVSQSADTMAIKRAYRTLAKKHHPDRGGNPQRFQRVQEAYETLCNPERRRTLDKEIERTNTRREQEQAEARRRQQRSAEQERQRARETAQRKRSAEQERQRARETAQRKRSAEQERQRENGATKWQRRAEEERRRKEYERQAWAEYRVRLAQWERGQEAARAAFLAEREQRERQAVRHREREWQAVRHREREWQAAEERWRRACEKAAKDGERAATIALVGLAGRILFMILVVGIATCAVIS